MQFQNTLDELYENLAADLNKFKAAFDMTKFIMRNPNPTPNSASHYITKMRHGVPIIVTEKQQIKLHAYVVSVHAIFEKFFEDLATYTIDESVGLYNTQNKVNIFLAKAIMVDQFDRENDISKTLLREGIQEAIKGLLNNTTHLFGAKLSNIIQKVEEKFKQYIKANNAVVSIYKVLHEHMGISKTTNPVLLTHLRSLENERHEFAHKGTISQQLSPADAQTYIDNVLLIAKDVTDQAKNLVMTVI